MERSGLLQDKNFEIDRAFHLEQQCADQAHKIRELSPRRRTDADLIKQSITMVESLQVTPNDLM